MTANPPLARRAHERIAPTFGLMRRWSLVLVGLTLSAGVQAEPLEPARGAELLAPFKRDLREALRQGLARGPAEAVAACQLQAPEIASSLSRDGIRLGRTSHRLRNPANAPPDWVRPLLNAYLSSPSDRAPRTVLLPNRRSGYAEPILVQSLCLPCHGEVLAPEVASRVEELYPGDQAIGFRPGDLRGVFWVEFSTAE